MAVSEASRFSKSFKPFKTNEDYLYAVKEDLAEWLNGLHSADLTAEGFFNTIDDGIMLCQHANKVREYLLSAQIQAECVKYKREVKKQSWHARDNVANFIAWIKTHLAINDVLLFETDDLVLRKNMQSVLLCLLQVAREGSKFGMDVPMLVHLEKEIEQSEQQLENPGKPAEVEPDPAKLKEAMEMLMSLDELVQESLRVCTCPNQFPMYQVDKGKYRIGESKTIVFVRVLRNHVMVRVGGGWDTLQSYLNKHDPCRCANGGHRRTAPTSQSVYQAQRSVSPARQSATLPRQRNRSVDSSSSKSAADDPQTPLSPRRANSLARTESKLQRAQSQRHHSPARRQGPHLTDSKTGVSRPTVSAGCPSGMSGSRPQPTERSRVRRTATMASTTGSERRVPTERRVRRTGSNASLTRTERPQPIDRKQHARRTGSTVSLNDDTENLPLPERRTVRRSGSNVSLSGLEGKTKPEPKERRRNVSMGESTISKLSRKGSARGSGRRDQLMVLRNDDGKHSVSAVPDRSGRAGAPLTHTQSTPSSPTRATSEPPFLQSLPTSPMEQPPPFPGSQAGVYQKSSSKRGGPGEVAGYGQLSPSEMTSSAGTTDSESLMATAMAIKAYFSEDALSVAFDDVPDGDTPASKSWAATARKAPRQPGKTKIPCPVDQSRRATPAKETGSRETAPPSETTICRVDSGVELFSPKSCLSDESS